MGGNTKDWEKKREHEIADMEAGAEKWFSLWTREDNKQADKDAKRAAENQAKLLADVRGDMQRLKKKRKDCNSAFFLLELYLYRFFL